MTRHPHPGARISTPPRRSRRLTAGRAISARSSPSRACAATRADGSRRSSSSIIPAWRRPRSPASAGDAAGALAAAGLTVIHRYGRSRRASRSSWCSTASSHRRAAFEAAEFLMDYLKTRAPFWKREHRADGGTGDWVEAKEPDERAPSGGPGLEAARSASSTLVAARRSNLNCAGRRPRNVQPCADLRLQTCASRTAPRDLHCTGGSDAAASPIRCVSPDVRSSSHRRLMSGGHRGRMNSPHWTKAPAVRDSRRRVRRGTSAMPGRDSNGDRRRIRCPVAELDLLNFESPLPGPLPELCLEWTFDGTSDVIQRDDTIR